MDATSQSMYGGGMIPQNASQTGKRILLQFSRPQTQYKPSRLYSSQNPRRVVLNNTGSTVTNAAPTLPNRGLSSQNVAHRPKTNLVNVGSTVHVDKLNNNHKIMNGSDYGHRQ